MDEFQLATIFENGMNLHRVDMRFATNQGKSPWQKGAYCVPIVNIFDIDLQNLIKQWDKIPKYFKLTDKPPSITANLKQNVTIWKDGKPLTLQSRKTFAVDNRDDESDRQ